jgi:hypothetical protein
MTARSEASLKRAHRAIGEHVSDFYRCYRCYRLITLPQMVRALERQDQLAICPCGGAKFQTSHPLWYEWALPRVLAFAWQRAGDLGWAGLVENARADWQRWRTKPV